MNASDWHAGFLAASTIAGEPLEAAVEALGAAKPSLSRMGHCGATEARLLRELVSSAREVRARAAAITMTSIVLEMDAVEDA